MTQNKRSEAQQRRRAKERLTATQMNEDIMSLREPIEVTTNHTSLKQSLWLSVYKDQLSRNTQDVAKQRATQAIKDFEQQFELNKETK